MSIFCRGALVGQETAPFSFTSAAPTDASKSVPLVRRSADELPANPEHCRGSGRRANYRLCPSSLRRHPYLCLHAPTLLFLCLSFVVGDSDTVLAHTLCFEEFSAHCRSFAGSMRHDPGPGKLCRRAEFSESHAADSSVRKWQAPDWSTSWKSRPRPWIRPPKKKNQFPQRLGPSPRLSPAAALASHSATSGLGNVADTASSLRASCLCPRQGGGVLSSFLSSLLCGEWRGCLLIQENIRTPQWREPRQAGSATWTRGASAGDGGPCVSLAAFVTRTAAAPPPARQGPHRRLGLQRSGPSTSVLRQREGGEAQKAGTELTMVKQRKYQLATDNIFIGLRDAQVQRNLRRKQMMLDYRPLRQYYKHKIAQATSADERLDWHRRLQRLPRDSAPTRYRNRCHICGRARGYFRFFGLCRHHVLDMVRNAMFPGFTKAEW